MSIIFICTIILLLLIVINIDTVAFDGTDPVEGASSPVDKEAKEPVTEPQTVHASDYSNNSKWYVERMKMAHDLLMEHEFKWLELEKEEYEKTKVLPENSLHSNIAEFREQDAKEMLAINEALNKFNLNENPNDIGSNPTGTENKRSIVEEDQTSASVASHENKKSRIVAENETNVDNVTKNVNSNNK